MRALGIDIAASDLHFVIIESAEKGEQLVTANKLHLADTRDVKGIKAFQSALTTIFTEANATVIAIRSKPESGRMRAGAAALKMEALVLAQSLSPVRFISNQRLSAQESPDYRLPQYYEPAVKTALAAIQDAT